MPSSLPDHPPASLSDLVQHLSARYVRGASFTDIFEALLPDLLAFTGSAMGFIGHLDTDEQGPLLQAVAHPAHDWSATTAPAVFTDLGKGHLVFRDFNTLFGQVITTGRCVISNAVDHDVRAKATPQGHLPIQQFLGIPLVHGGTLVGMVALANRPSGYTDTLIDTLQSAVAVLSNIVGAIDLERARREALLAQTQAQDSLKRNDAYYQQIFEVAGVGIARVAPDGRLQDVNQRFADICQRSRADLLRLNFRDITHPDDLPVNMALQESTLQGHQDRYTMDKRYLVPQGGIVWVQVTTVLVRDPQGQPLHFVTVAEDISERKRYQEAILSAQAAERASKAKTEFLSRMSHELRTPLNAMLGFAQLLRVDPRHPLNEVQHTKVRYIEQAGSHLLAMLTDVLDLSRIEAGSLPLSLEPLRISDVAQEALTMVAHEGVERGITLSQAGIDTTLYVRGDQVRLRQILVNLLSNAIKYNRPQGQVRVEVQVLKPHVMVSVHDTGPGLSPEQQAHLFEPFNRLGAERTAIEGTGIGLVIVKRLIGLMNGRIEVSSVLGEGSVFRVVLPWAQSPTLDEHDPAGTRSGFGELAGQGDVERKLTMLYGEDNAVNVELVRHVMRMRPQWHMRVATCGAETIEMALAQPPDLLLLDMHLGDMTGLDVADALSHHPHTMGLLKVALSADVMPDQLRAAKERGFVDYLTKPLEVARLLKVLDAFVSPQAEDQPITMADR
jgi:PAS domain S-box-containing protein